MFTVEAVAGLPAEEVHEMLLALDDLRASGAVNMFGAAPHLQAVFGLSVAVARKVLAYWIGSFDQRHGAGRTV